MSVEVTQLKDKNGSWDAEMVYDSMAQTTKFYNKEGHLLFTLLDYIPESIGAQAVELYHHTYSIAFNRGESHGRAELALDVQEILGIDKIVQALRGKK